MSLKLKKVDSFKTRVVVQQPGANPDKPDEATFIAEFKHIDSDAFDALMERQPKDSEFIDEMLVGVSEIQDEAGQGVPFEAAKAAIKGDLALRGATVRACIEALGGAREKNSLRSRGR